MARSKRPGRYAIYVDRMSLGLECIGSLLQRSATNGLLRRYTWPEASLFPTSNFVKEQQVALEDESAQVKAMIQSFYQFANVPLAPELEVNERVAEVFGIMLNESRKCSKAFGLVPTPPGGRASIAWLAMQLKRGVFNHYRSQMSFTCARGVIYQWNRELELASMGLATERLPTWA